MEPLLQLERVSKRYGDVPALEDVSLSVARGTVHALLGENGAGKTTLMSIAYGLVRPDRGTLTVSGLRRRLRSPVDALDAGVGMVQQHFSLVPAMTVAENVSLGMRGPYGTTTGRTTVLELAQSTGLAIDPDARVADLSIGGQQRVEILKALARSASVLILDEPTAVLSPQEGRELLQWVRAFCSVGHAAVLITHKLEEARTFADEVTVLRGGRATLSARAPDVSSEQLVRAMLGEDLSFVSGSEPPRVVGPVLVRADHISLRDARGVVRVRDASFEVRAGEIVGVAGVEGAGQHELLRAAAGRLRPDSGVLTLPQRIGYAPDDRLSEALIPQFDLRQNLALHDANGRRGLMRWKHLEKVALTLLAEFDIRAPHVRLLVKALSGGNQQKFVFARELHDHPHLLVAVNPTRGLDVRASQSLLQRIRQARDAGMAVLMHSSDIDEMLACCDRILVAHAGDLVEVPRDRDQVGRALVGAA